MKKLEGGVALVMGAEDAEALAERIRGKTLGRQRRSTRVSAILPRRRLSWMRRSNNAGGTNMNSLKDKVALSADAVYVILGASGNTGSIIVDSLLSKGKKVRVVGRDLGRLHRFVRQGAEAFTAYVSDAAALTKAFSGARGAYLMSPPPKSQEDQERESDAIAKTLTEAGLRYAVHLSACGAQVPEGTGPIA